MVVFYVVFLLVFAQVNSQAPLEDRYYNYTEIEEFLTHISDNHPTISHLYSIGTSVEGRELWVVALGKSAHKHVTLQPEVKYVANMHGDETVPVYLMMKLIEYIVTSYGEDTHVTTLLDRSRVHILVSLNPDGYHNITQTWMQDGQCDYYQTIWARYNANKKDLNRNYPDYFYHKDALVLERETEAVIHWINSTQFVLSGNLHTGALLVTYPYSGSQTLTYTEAPSRDDAEFQHLSRAYSYAHRDMYLGRACHGWTATEGIINSPLWYPVVGCSKDYHYIYAGCMEVTIEVSCCKYPPAVNLTDYWEANRQALVTYLQQANMGVKGLVRSERECPLEGASVLILGRDHPTNTTADGEYWRLLLPGNYTLQVSLSGYENTTIEFEVTSDGPTILNVTMATTGMETTGLDCRHKHSVEGVVMSDKECAVEGAVVSTVATGQSANTSMEGEYQLMLAPGNYTIQVSLEGYESTSIQIEVTNAGPIIVNITMASLAMEPDCRQKYIVGGVVRSDKQCAVEGAVVSTVETGQQSANTSREGEYQLLLAPGNYTIQASSGRFRNTTVHITVRSGETTTVDIVLNPPSRSSVQPDCRPTVKNRASGRDHMPALVNSIVILLLLSHWTTSD